MQDNALKIQAFRLKGRLYTLTVMQLLCTDDALIGKQLDAVVSEAPNLFNETPLVLDLSLIKSEHVNWQQLRTHLSQRHLLLVAIQGGSDEQNAQARQQGLAILHASSTHDKPLKEPQVRRSMKSSLAKSSTGKLVSQPVRSGQQVVSKGDDLVILSSVSHGSELMSDGHIHVYGTLRGRALAGMLGNQDARIFCLSLDAELISIAGFYRTREEFEAIQGPCQIYLENESLRIVALT